MSHISIPPYLLYFSLPSEMHARVVDRPSTVLSGSVGQVDQVTSQGQSALHVTATSCSVEGLLLLLRSGASDANQRGNSSCLDYLYKKEQQQKTLQYIFMQTNLKHFYFLPLLDTDGRSPLHVLCEASPGYPSQQVTACVEALLKHGYIYIRQFLT
jgi:ankyrin repeat protein